MKTRDSIPLSIFVLLYIIGAMLVPSSRDRAAADLRTAGTTPFVAHL
jgi:hypothetical protein